MPELWASRAILPDGSDISRVTEAGCESRPAVPVPVFGEFDRYGVLPRPAAPTGKCQLFSGVCQRRRMCQFLPANTDGRAHNNIRLSLNVATLAKVRVI
jgi:hypothetical protein